MTGPPAKMSYDEAETRFLGILEKLLPMAEAHRIPFVLEPVGAMHLRLGYIHTLQDGLDLADKVNSPWLKLCFEMGNMWIERRLYENIATRVQHIGLVQISDVVPGMHDYSRIALGDGVVPIDRIIRAFQQAGYQGYYDIEILGPEVEKIGYEETIRRSLEWVRRI
jgi:sugar phosphate isomerase/epimerase